MRVKIPANVREAMREIAREFGRQGGKKAARNSTPEERSARAKKASLAAAKKRTQKRLAVASKQTEGKEELMRTGLRQGAFTFSVAAQGARKFYPR